MPSTARTTPSSVKKCVLRPFTSRRRSAMGPPTFARELPPACQFAERVQRAADIVAIHVLVGHAADRGRAHRVDLDLAGGAAAHEVLGGGHRARGVAAIDPED